MPRPATPIRLTESERAQLENWLRQPKVEARFADRARMILWAAEGFSNKQIAQRLDTRLARVSKWRTRFDQERLAGLADDFRPGIAPKYGAQTRARILKKLDESPPQGYSTWSGPLLAKALGDVNVHHVWRELRSLGLSLARRRSWCLSTDPEFARKAADIVALYLNPPQNAVVIAVDEKPCIQALERAQGWIRLPNGKSLTGHAHEYKRHGTSTLFAALDILTGQIKAGHYPRRRRREFLDFMNDLVKAHRDKEMHVILDNLNTHKPKNDRWLAQHPKVRLHYTPTHASWLNQVEIWFSILSRQALRGANFHSVQELREKIDAFISAYNRTAAPFEWTKANVPSKPFANKYSKLCK
jgi:transposase